jgi:hypothetical protein
MSFDKSYKNRKDHRKPYRGSRAVDRSCRPGGDCPWCRGKRKYKRDKPTACDGRREDGTEL